MARADTTASEAASIVLLMMAQRAQQQNKLWFIRTSFAWICSWKVPPVSLSKSSFCASAVSQSTQKALIRHKNCGEYFTYWKLTEDREFFKHQVALRSEKGKSSHLYLAAQLYSKTSLIFHMWREEQSTDNRYDTNLVNGHNLNSKCFNTMSQSPIHTHKHWVNVFLTT